MRRFFVMLLVGWILIGAVGLCLGQCPGGQCFPSDAQYGDAPSALATEIPRPRSAWRYESPRGHYRSVVRIQTFDRDGSRSLGSGCAVRWGGRVVILTARHVVKDARAVFVRGKHKYHRCKVLKTDGTWDVAALEPDDPADFDPADIAWQETGHPRAGDRLESCGFGANNRLAVNGGRFIGYRTTMRNRRQADWLVLSGYARQGDSGGPVFNGRGELVGVLWGAANGEVVATQCGRLHVFLTQAVGPFRSKTKTRIAVRQRQIVPVSYPRETGLFSGGQPLLNPNREGPLARLCPTHRKPPAPTPAPQVIVQSDPTISGKLDQLIVNTSPPPPEEAETGEQRTHPLVMFLVIGGCVAIGFVVYFASQKGE